jgi:hypothetical protein
MIFEWSASSMHLYLWGQCAIVIQPWDVIVSIFFVQNKSSTIIVHLYNELDFKD